MPAAGGAEAAIFKKARPEKQGGEKENPKRLQADLLLNTKKKPDRRGLPLPGFLFCPSVQPSSGKRARARLPAAPSSYGGNHKISRVETLFHRVDHNGRGLSSCKRRSGIEVVVVITVEDTGSLAGVHVALAQVAMAASSANRSLVPVIPGRSSSRKQPPWRVMLSPDGTRRQSRR